MIAYVGGPFNGTDANDNFINQVLETTNGGTSWTDITVGADGNGVHPDHHAMTFDANGKLLDGNDGGVWRLDDSTPSVPSSGPTSTPACPRCSSTASA